MSPERDGDRPAFQSGVPVRVVDLRDKLLMVYRQKERSAGTIRAMLTSFKALFGFFGEETLAELLTFDVLLEYVDKRRRTHAPATIDRELSFLRTAMGIYAKAGKLKVPPFPELEYQNARQDFFESKEFKAVLEFLPWDLRPFATFLWLTGWRSSEAKALTWANVNWEIGMVNLPTSKNGEPRSFPFKRFRQLKRLLEQQRAATRRMERKLEKIIPTVFWRGADPRGFMQGAAIGSFWHAWNTARTRAGCPEKNPHDFRRTSARRMDNAGIPRSVAKKLLGLRSDAIYDRYRIVPTKDIEAASEELGDYLEGGAKREACGDDPDR
jgi:integrase